MSRTQNIGLTTEGTDCKSAPAGATQQAAKTTVDAAKQSQQQQQQ